MTKIYKRFQVKALLFLLFLHPVFSCQSSEEARVNTQEETSDLVADSVNTPEAKEEPVLVEDAEVEEEVDLAEGPPDMHCGRFWFRNHGIPGKGADTQTEYVVIYSDPASAVTDSLNKVFKREAQQRHVTLDEEYRRGLRRMAETGAKGELQKLWVVVTPSIIFDRVLYIRYDFMDKYGPDLSRVETSTGELFDLQTGRKLAFEDVFTKGLKDLWLEQVKERMQNNHKVSGEDLTKLMRETEQMYSPHLLRSMRQGYDDDYAEWDEECMVSFWYFDPEGRMKTTDDVPFDKLKPYVKKPFRTDGPCPCSENY